MIKKLFTQKHIYFLNIRYEISRNRICKNSKHKTELNIIPKKFKYNLKNILQRRRNIYQDRYGVSESFCTKDLSLLIFICAIFRIAYILRGLCSGAKTNWTCLCKISVLQMTCLFKHKIILLILKHIQIFFCNLEIFKKV